MPESTSDRTPDSAAESALIAWNQWGKQLTWMSEEYERRFGMPITLEEILDLTLRRDVQRRYIMLGTVMPWAVGIMHEESPVGQLLTSEFLRRRGVRQSAARIEALDAWLEVLRSAELVVDYCKDEGFLVVPPREGIDLDTIREPDPMPE